MKTKALWAFLAVAIAIALVSLQYYSPSVPRQHTSTGTEYLLSAQEIKALETKSTEGDANAAFRIAQYYLYCTDDYNSQLKWFQLAADLGNEPAKSWLKLLKKENDDGPTPGRESSQPK